MIIRLFTLYLAVLFSLSQTYFVSNTSPDRRPRVLAIQHRILCEVEVTIIIFLITETRYGRLGIG